MSINLKPFLQIDQVGRSIKPRSQACRTQNGRDHRRRGPLALRSGDVDQRYRRPVALFRQVAIKPKPAQQHAGSVEPKRITSRTTRHLFVVDAVIQETKRLLITCIRGRTGCGIRRRWRCKVGQDTFWSGDVESGRQVESDWQVESAWQVKPGGRVWPNWSHGTRRIGLGFTGLRFQRASISEPLRFHSGCVFTAAFSPKDRPIVFIAGFHR